ncbi:hypothetical protein [Streptomyces monashensis]|uniref:Uncharacterized protein n=1 Tax=Streptomyces monashensis TaxID=1678012 RepID=A0A1S2QKH0_9ACTN|nr:hypothetical protein [Streptomyces monashensis]OIK06081.1 hypothetical protein BIV23_08785 [Streptomyces monashensis]
MRKVLPLALAALFALSACQFTDRLSGDDDPAGEARRLNAVSAFPLYAYDIDPSAADSKAVDRAQWILAKRCMVRLGFSGFAVLDTKSVESTYPVRQGTLDLSSSVGDDRPYGVDDPDLASEHGYHNHDLAAGTQDLEWPTDQFLALTAEFGTGDSHFAHGHRIPDGGCLGQARQRITGPTPATKADGVRLTGTTSIAMRLWIQSGKEARQDPAWKKADHAWSDCMKKRGFHYADPDAASLDTAWFRTEKPTGKERKTAAADATCKLDTGYIQSVHAVQARAQKSAIRRNKQELEDQRAAQQRAVRNARAIVAAAS